MNSNQAGNLFKILLCILLLPLPEACVDPVEPQFDFTEGLLYIDGLAGTETGASYVLISRAVKEYGINTNVFVSGAEVYFINMASGASVLLSEQEEVYLPPADFVARPGDTWELKLVLPGGEEYRSLPETLREAVPLTSLDVSYDPELVYSSEYDEFAPGHRISVTLDDPPLEDNYYYWRYRSYETLQFCKVCYFSIYRGEECIPWNSGPQLLPYYTYFCEGDCWKIRQGENIAIFSDEFANGNTIQNLPVADILLYTRQNIGLELQQYSLSRAAYDYYKTLQDLVDNNSGFNAPIPAALVGNLYNTSDPEEFVLGRFTAAATSRETIFIERHMIKEEPLEVEVFGQSEGAEAPPLQVSVAPCREGRYTTSIKPYFWPD